MRETVCIQRARVTQAMTNCSATSLPPPAARHTHTQTQTYILYTDKFTHTLTSYPDGSIWHYAPVAPRPPLRFSRIYIYIPVVFTFHILFEWNQFFYLSLLPAISSGGWVYVPDILKILGRFFEDPIRSDQMNSVSSGKEADKTSIFLFLSLLFSSLSLVAITQSSLHNYPRFTIYI